jgi:hypothetical protein
MGYRAGRRPVKAAPIANFDITVQPHAAVRRWIVRCTYGLRASKAAMAALV